MKLLVLNGIDAGMLESDINTPARAITEIEGILWEGRGATIELARQHLARRLRDSLNYEINIRNPDFDHVKQRKIKGRYDV